MSVKILGGLLKGLPIQTPNIDILRPTSVMLKRKIFDANQSLNGHDFYDLCAGSGAIGLEAWSRGANSVTMFEPHPKLYSSLKSNISKLKGSYKKDFEQRPINLIKGKFQGHLDFSSLGGSSLIFLDPPYERNDLYQLVIDRIKEVQFKGILWLEADGQKGEDQKFWLKKLDIDPNLVKVYSSGARYIISSDFGL